ncbi:amidohydrolase family protein [Rhodococcus opacus]|uniref:amidohydrolase family protein n=1 Tax=Rhodococcus opacus TaxID=37919 RepID=UPI00155B0506|nr:amidohydrolase family protein [Rhodococcus opacus]
MTRKVLIRGGYLIPTAERDTDIPEADILIEDDTITDVGESIDADVDHIVDATGRVVIPGLIDVHRPLWETVLGNSIPDATWPEYQRRRHTLRQVFTPDDVYAGTLLGAASAIHSGVTTIVDFDDLASTPDHIDATVSALRRAQVRAVHAVVGAGGRAERAGAPGPLPAAGVVWTGPDPVHVDRIRGAREQNLPIYVDVGRCPAAVEQLAARIALGTDMIYLNAGDQTARSLALIAESGGTVSWSPTLNAVTGQAPTAWARFAAAGLTPAVAAGGALVTSLDPFDQLRSAYQQARLAAHQANRRGTGGAVPTARTALGWATTAPARGLRLGHLIGTLEPGKQADLVVLDLDALTAGPVSCPVTAVVLGASAAHVTDVFVAGRRLKRDRVLMDIDSESVGDAAHEAHVRIRLAAGRRPAAH